MLRCFQHHERRKLWQLEASVSSFFIVTKLYIISISALLNHEHRLLYRNEWPDAKWRIKNKQTKKKKSNNLVDLQDVLVLKPYTPDVFVSYRFELQHGETEQRDELLLILNDCQASDLSQALQSEVPEHRDIQELPEME